MAIIAKVAKIGNNFHIRLPMSLCRLEGIKAGDYFKIEKDVMTGTFYFDKIGNDDGSVNKKTR